MWDRLTFIVKRLRERLWVKPLVICLLSIAAVGLADLLDDTALARYFPLITKESTEALLKIMASSMLVMATFAVGSMVSAYASASSTATPRSFPLILGDDVSQLALSAFLGAFIYSVIALVALMNDFYNGRSGSFILFLLTMCVFAAVVVTFIGWVDSIARLGRLGFTIDKVEQAALAAIRRRQAEPRLGGKPASGPPADGQAIYANSIGYLQRIDVQALQARAAESHLQVVVAALPGAFCTPRRPVAWSVAEQDAEAGEGDAAALAAAFVIGDARVFDQDPRFGLIALSEIASRALSPAVNDPGTAIDVTHTLVRLFAGWSESGQATEESEPRYDRVAVPELALADLFDDAFTGIARDGASIVEVVLRLLKSLEALAALGDVALRRQAVRHARLALTRAERALQIPEDLAAVREAANFAADEL